MNKEQKAEKLEKENKELRKRVKDLEKLLRIAEARSKPRSGAYF